ncbi:hypothetical protein J056_001785 [Wallemia ichthyophaga EXF-994]|uniref:Uncharacterized protein n=1 Tax=Wallemia ichthyophaga (strain EXF-994 / CBS 113033) TaxID=1299270 RepID=R9ABF9_WALI9|nr:uncharacterized protein J056_001785 [Wallemia ichthyophaga EXF-994]EOQ99462.1 hypothetical protein J056_001785 [Wallemia ichthyophaga EXF-994]
MNHKENDVEYEENELNSIQFNNPLNISSENDHSYLLSSDSADLDDKLNQKLIKSTQTPTNNDKGKALVSNERSRTNDFNLFSQESCNSEQQDNHFNTIASTALTKQLSADSTNSSTFDLS